MKRPIAIGLAPDMTIEDVLLSLRYFFTFWRYNSGKHVKMLEVWFRQYFDVSYAVSFNTGRSALYAILRALNIGVGDEVLLQTFTCVAVPNAVLWAGAKPVFVDINKTLTMDVSQLEKKITKKTKGIIVQHTFGIPTEMEKVQKIAKKYDLFIIEDCAHTVGGKYENKKLGRYSDAAFFSFGRDKAFSSVFGGMAITNNELLGKQIRNIQKQRPYPAFFWTAQQLFHPIALSIVLPFYNLFSLGKVLLVIFQKLHFLSLPVTLAEKKSNISALDVRRMPNALCVLAYAQLKNLEKNNTIRASHVKQYLENLNIAKTALPCDSVKPLLRFPLLVANRDEFLAYCKKQGVYIGNWYTSIIDPAGVDYKKLGYERSHFPVALEMSRRIVNLPTYPTLTEKQVSVVIDLVKKYAHYQTSHQ